MKKMRTGSAWYQLSGMFNLCTSNLKQGFSLYGRTTISAILIIYLLFPQTIGAMDSPAHTSKSYQALHGEPDTVTGKIDRNTTFFYSQDTDLLPDSDMDGLPDVEETKWGTDPVNPDTDNDTVLDGEEVNQYNIHPLKKDSDGDRLRLFGSWLVVQLIILACFLPWIPNALAQAGSNATYFPGRVTWNTVFVDTWRAFNVGEWGDMPLVGWLWLAMVLLGVVAGLTEISHRGTEAQSKRKSSRPGVSMSPWQSSAWP